MPNVTPNLGLIKPLGNEIVSRQAYVENLDIVDQHAAKRTDLSEHLAQVIHPKLNGTANFNGAIGTVIPHTKGDTNYFVGVTPVANPAGYLGEVWVEQAANSFSVKCSGIATTSFKYVVLW
ncbi:hypothetical protein [Desulforamulus aeronauticus]|uniref:Uncharacterized protein n=1 Tax=Desulforamulus aeronauticus DSM 10349 TaxID=1121421 RepID=A0A1M6WHM3_9FIRM|nr:hypothetical protein [Desulforamulus aeronauticus]SHK93139.1 hypothetical protein SAMN02745123_03637 [Desulforamulus aeronauticus DSM 10349]